MVLREGGGGLFGEQGPWNGADNSKWNFIGFRRYVLLCKTKCNKTSFQPKYMKSLLVLSGFCWINISNLQHAWLRVSLSRRWGRFQARRQSCDVRVIPNFIHSRTKQWGNLKGPWNTCGFHTSCANIPASNLKYVHKEKWRGRGGSLMDVWLYPFISSRIKSALTNVFSHCWCVNHFQKAM